MRPPYVIKKLLSCRRFILAGQVDIRNWSQYSIELLLTFSYMHGHQFTLLPFGVLPKCSRPFRHGICCFQIIGRKHSYRTLRILTGFVHFMYKVLSCFEIPALKNHRIASILQLLSNPFGPLLVRVGVADEKVFFNCLPPFFNETLIYCRIVFFVILYLSNNSISLSIRYLNCKSQKVGSKELDFSCPLLHL